MKHGTITLNTNRLILRRFVMDDAQKMFENWASDEEVTTYLTWPVHKDISVTEYILELWISEYPKDDCYHWAICTKENEPIGDLAIVKELDGVPVIGYCLSRNYWGLSIMPEAVSAMMDYLFNIEGYDKLCCYHDVNNPKSGRVMQKCGMRFIETRVKVDHNNQGVCDIDYYEITKDEYNRLKK